MLRITGGRFRGRMLHTPKNEKTRPTQARLRQALFNSLQGVISEAKVLDLFAGGGALGFEAISWGAAQVAFVEQDRGALQLLRKNSEELQVQQEAEIVGGDVKGCWHRLAPFMPFDIVLADPPYAEGWEKFLLEHVAWNEVLRPEGLFCLEWGWVKSLDFKKGALPDAVGELVKVREKNYGDTVLTTFQRGKG